MSNLMTQLADLIIRDNMILFVGTGLRHGHGELSMVQQIAEALARRIDYQRSDRSLSAVACDFEVLHGRQALIQALMDELQKLDREPSPVHQLIVASMLEHTKVVTTRFDCILERTLEQFQKPYVLIVRDNDLPFFDESKITLIKMQGDINQPDSLVITEDDSDAFLSKLPTLSDVIRAFFATKTLVFVGYDLSSDLFKRFFRQVNRNLSVFSRTAYAIVPEPLDEVEVGYWASQNVKICPDEPLAFLEALSQAVKEATSRTLSIPRHSLKAPQATLPPRPYKGLLSFTVKDRLIFVGRAEESQRLSNRILAHRSTVLYGESGSGKSSLLAAAVSPLLAQRGALLAVVEPLTKKPLAALIQERLTQVAQAAGLSGGNSGGEDTSSQLPVMIRAWQRQLDGPIVIAIDHFESFFLRYSGSMREEGIKFLSISHLV